MASHPALTSSSVVLVTSGGQAQSKLIQIANTVQSILTGLAALIGIYMTLFIIIKCMPDADDPREESEVYHAVDRAAGLVALVAAVVWLLL